MMTYSKNMLKLTAVFSLIWIVGCQTEDDYRKERADRAVRYFEVSKFKILEENRRFTLAECIQLALNNNLDIKVFHQEEDIASELKTADLLSMLPDLSINDSFHARNNVNASSSQAYASDGATYGASTSQDNNINELNVDLALSVLDFGLAFYNTLQSQDRVILRKQRTMRMEQTLRYDVTRLYLQVATAQHAKGIIERYLSQCKDYPDQLSRLCKKGLITPFDAFRKTRDFYDMERLLKDYTRTYDNARSELRSLMGFYPSAQITVDDSVLSKMNVIKLPELEQMEQLALNRRPELREGDITHHINVLECHKAIITMLPTARVFLDYNNNSNSFLYRNNWWEFGIQSAFNLLKLPQKIAQAVAYSNQADAELVRNFGAAVAIIAEVRLAHADIMVNQDIYAKSDEYYRNCKEAYDNEARARALVPSGTSKLDYEYLQMKTAQANLERLFDLSRYYIACYRLVHAIGMKNSDLSTLDNVPQLLKEDAELLAKK